MGVKNSQYVASKFSAPSLVHWRQFFTDWRAEVILVVRLLRWHSEVAFNQENR